MKKLFLIMAASAVLLSCSGQGATEKKCIRYLDAYYNAVKAGNLERADEFEEDYEDWYDKLSVEEQLKADKAFEKWYEKHGEALEKAEDAAYGKAYRNALRALGSQASDLYDDASEYAEEVYDFASEYAEDIYDSASEYAEDVYDSASELAEDLLEDLEDLF